MPAKHTRRPTSAFAKSHSLFLGGYMLLLAGVPGLACSAAGPERTIRWRSVTPDGTHTCGVSVAGETFCWGAYSGLWLDPAPPKDSLMPNSALPVAIPGGRLFAAVTPGGGPYCALDPAGAAFCWGTNFKGELGDSSYMAKRTPVAVRYGYRWQTVSADGQHVCGVTLEGRAYCWGNQFRGLLGNGQLDGSQPTPVAVAGNLVFKAIDAEGSTCALTTGGEAYCWGPNDYGQLGDSTPPRPYPESATPSRVVGGHVFTSIARGGYHTCGIAEDGLAFCWGWNIVGQLGDGTTTHTSVPTPVAGNLRWRLLAAGNSHTCGLTIDDAFYCWGGNERGEFGDGTMTEKSTTPLRVNLPLRPVSITAGGYNTCALTAAGTAFCWGRGDYGQLGNGVMANSATPVQVASPR